MIINDISEKREDVVDLAQDMYRYTANLQSQADKLRSLCNPVLVSSSCLKTFINGAVKDIYGVLHSFAAMQNILTDSVPAKWRKHEDACVSDTLIQAVYTTKAIIVHTPRAVRPSIASTVSNPYPAWVVTNALKNIPRDALSQAAEIHEYMLLVYPSDVKTHLVTDLDNIDTKVFSDVIFNHISKDDNAKILAALCKYSVFTDRLPEGMYIVLTSAKNGILSGKKLQKIIEKNAKRLSLFVKNENTENEIKKQ